MQGANWCGKSVEACCWRLPSLPLPKNQRASRRQGVGGGGDKINCRDFAGSVLLRCVVVVIGCVIWRPGSGLQTALNPARAAVQDAAALPPADFGLLLPKIILAVHGLERSAHAPSPTLDMQEASRPGKQNHFNGKRALRTTKSIARPQQFWSFATSNILQYQFTMLSSIAGNQPVA